MKLPVPHRMCWPAARRLGFRRRINTHPVDSLEEPKLAIGALGIAFLELGGLPTEEQQNALLKSLQARTGQSLDDAEETLISRPLAGPRIERAGTGDHPAVAPSGKA